MEEQTNKVWAESLNKQVQKYQQEGMNSFDAIEQVASENRLEMISEGDDCRIYETQDGMLVNCWLDENTEGGQKSQKKPFDNNVSWFTGNK